MAAPNYTTDLTTIANANIATDGGTWEELTGHTSGGAATAETDYFIQGTQCVSQSVGGKTGTLVGLQYTHTADVTLTAGQVFTMWHVFLPANAINTFANGGMRFGIGSSAGNMRFWNTGGSDFGRNPYGGWHNVAVDPTYTPVDVTDGSPTGTYRVFGSMPNITGSVSKGNPHGVDAIRYGRCELIIEFGDGTNGYGTFTGLGTQNDNISNRWGLFQLQAGQYLWKGLMSFGNATNACDFRDSNINIAVDRTPRTYASFNRIEIKNASSRVDWTGVNISALSSAQLSRGQFECVQNATVNLDLCTFTDMSTFIFQSNSTITDTTFRRCELVTQGGSTMSGCLFDAPSGAVGLLVNSSTLITNCRFESKGTGHAVQGFSTAGDYTLVGWSFAGFAASNGSTGNEAIYVTATTGTVNLNLSGGTSPSIRTAGATVNVIQSAVLTVGGIRANSDVWIYRADNKTLLSSADPVTITDGAPIDGVQYYKLVYSYNAAALSGVAVQIKVFNLGYINERINYTLTSSDARVGVQQRIDRNYNNP